MDQYLLLLMLDQVFSSITGVASSLDLLAEPQLTMQSLQSPTALMLMVAITTLSKIPGEQAGETKAT
jgi:hypothetical protein